MAKRDMGRPLFYAFLVIFVMTALVTLLGVTKVLDIAEGYLPALFTALILEVVGSIIALFRVVFGLASLRMALHFGEDPPDAGLTACKCTIRPSQSGKQPSTHQLNLVKQAGALVVRLPDVGPDDSVELEMSEDGRTWRSYPLDPFLSHADMLLR